ncbi:MAG: VWA domain-containing protein [Kofleriaceae bacterium]
MTWLAPLAGRTVGLAALAAAALVIIAYLLKMRRRRFEVPFSNLWKRVLEQRDANSLWKQLRRLLSLLLALAMAGLIIAAIQAPTLGVTDRRARNVVVLVDSSASMRAVDGDPARPTLTRFARAQERTAALIDALGGGDQAMIMRVDAQATPVSRFASDKPMLRKALDELVPSDTGADLPRALSAAADALRGRANPLIVVVSDGAYPELDRNQVSWAAPADAPPPAAGADPDDATASFATAQLAAVDLAGIDVRYLGVGTRADNVGIVAFNVRRYIANKAAFEVFIEVENFGPEPARRQLALKDGDTAIELLPIELAPGERKRLIYRQLPGGASQLSAELRAVDGPGGSDPFPLDDQAWALLPARKKQHVLLVTNDNLYLEGAMLVYDNIEVYKATPAEYDAAPAATVTNTATGKPYDVVVFDDVTPAVIPPPPINVMWFHPDGAASPFAIRGVLPRPRITDTADTHPVMKWVTMSDVNFDAANVFAVDASKGEVALVRSVRDAIAVARRDAGRKLIGFGWSLAGTDLMLRVAFPLLLVNSLDWFAGDDSDLVTTYPTGTRLRIPLDGLAGLTEVTVVDPLGHRGQAPVVDGAVTLVTHQIGIHQIIAYPPGTPPDAADATPLASFEVATNLSSPAESRIAPAVDLVLSGRTLEAPPTFAVSARRDLWLYLVLAVIGLLCIEWITYHRRITV